MFQFPINDMIPIVATAGDRIGITILWKEYNSLAPSILAASIRDLDREDSVYCFRKNTVPGEAIAGIISGM